MEREVGEKGGGEINGGEGRDGGGKDEEREGEGRIPRDAGGARYTRSASTTRGDRKSGQLG